jgi:hypothetical protein
MENVKHYNQTLIDMNLHVFWVQLKLHKWKQS